MHSSSLPPFAATPAKSFFPPLTGPGRRLKASPTSGLRPPGPTFQERFCQARRIPERDFSRAMLKAGLYPHARLLRPILEWWSPGNFVLDQDFIRGIGLIRTRRDFNTEAEVFRYAGLRQGFLHRVLRVRVSVARVNRLLDTYWENE